MFGGDGAKSRLDFRKGSEGMSDKKSLIRKRTIRHYEIMEYRRRNQQGAMRETRVK